MSNVLASERERGDAMVASDLEKLEALLDKDMVYVHATGLRHNKTQLLAYLHAGPRFLNVDLIEAHVEERADGALVSGELRMKLQRTPDSDPVEVRSWVSQFWVREANGQPAWRLRLFQSTRMDTSGGSS